MTILAPWGAFGVVLDGERKTSDVKVVFFLKFHTFLQFLKKAFLKFLADANHF